MSVLKQQLAEIESELLELTGKIINFRKAIDDLPVGGKSAGAYDYYVDLKQLEAIAQNAFSNHHVTFMKLQKC